MRYCGVGEMEGTSGWFREVALQRGSLFCGERLGGGSHLSVGVGTDLRSQDYRWAQGE